VAFGSWMLDQLDALNEPKIMRRGLRSAGLLSALTVLPILFSLRYQTYHTFTTEDAKSVVERELLTFLQTAVKEKNVKQQQIIENQINISGDHSEKQKYVENQVQFGESRISTSTTREESTHDSFSIREESNEEYLHKASQPVEKKKKVRVFYHAFSGHTEFDKRKAEFIMDQQLQQISEAALASNSSHWIVNYVTVGEEGAINISWVDSVCKKHGNLQCEHQVGTLSMERRTKGIPYLTIRHNHNLLNRDITRLDTKK
jgi:hypothetical protein